MQTNQGVLTKYRFYPVGYWGVDTVCQFHTPFGPDERDQSESGKVLPSSEAPTQAIS
jgi:hypothetical protein